MTKSYAYKLAVLNANEDQLKQKDQMCLRIRDKMQSYNIYDSESYYQEKLIMQRLEREILEMDYLDLVDRPIVADDEL